MSDSILSYRPASEYRSYTLRQRTDDCLRLFYTTPKNPPEILIQANKKRNNHRLSNARQLLQPTVKSETHFEAIGAIYLSTDSDRQLLVRCSVPIYLFIGIDFLSVVYLRHQAQHHSVCTHEKRTEDENITQRDPGALGALVSEPIAHCTRSRRLLTVIYAHWSYQTRTQTDR